MTKNTLIEIHTEELPPKQLKSLSEQFLQIMQVQLNKNGFTFDGIDVFATPRRLALKIHCLSEKAADQIRERKGPAVSQAFDAKESPLPALLGFAKSCGVNDFHELAKKFFGDKEHFVFNEVQLGHSIFIALPNLIETALSLLPAKKRMRWGEGEYEFIRPIRSIILLFGETVVEANIMGVNSGRLTRGHRQHQPEWISIASADSYEHDLEQAGVVASFERRKKIIIQHACDRIKTHSNQADLVWSEELIDEVTGLVENPVILLGKFSETFLELPREVLIAVMRDHQRYFAVQTQDGKLLPCFVLIANLESKQPEKIISGNERVLHARFSDALFFYKEDLKKSWFHLDCTEKLKGMMFQGSSSIYDKILRIKKIAVFLAERLYQDKTKDPQWLARLELAAEKSKIDLLTSMVGEFPELQGIMGEHYLVRDKLFAQHFPEVQTSQFHELAKALYEQYLPRNSGDQLPSSNYGKILSIADRLDSLIFLSQTQGLPTGTKDPFGLRRMMIALIRIILENQWAINLSEWIRVVTEIVGAQDNNDTSKKSNPDDFILAVANFSKDRFKQEMQSQHQVLPDECEAILGIKMDDFNLYDCYLKLMALKELRIHDSEKLNKLVQLYKRIIKILMKNNSADMRHNLEAAHYHLAEEKNLLSTFLQIEKKWRSESNLNTRYEAQDYISFSQDILDLEDPLNEFFLHVLVEEEGYKQSRLQLLANIHKFIQNFADFSKLSSSI